jgi:hypothetical protein
LTVPRTAIISLTVSSFFPFKPLHLNPDLETARLDLLARLAFISAHGASVSSLEFFSLH